MAVSAKRKRKRKPAKQVSVQQQLGAILRNLTYEADKIDRTFADLQRLDDRLRELEREVKGRLPAPPKQ